MLTSSALSSGFRSLGIESGDVMLVHSSYKALGEVEGGPQTVIDALLATLGEAGTLIMPTFNFDFCKGQPWDVRSTPSRMGVLTELVRQDPRSCRVFHPIYSFAAIGGRQEAICGLRNKSSYGADSLFAKLLEWDARIMVIGLSYTDSMTFFHHVEEMEGVDYRYLKVFSGRVTGWDGNSYEDTFTMLVRDLDKGVITQVDPMGALLERVGIVTVGKIGDATVKVMSAKRVYEFTAREMRRDPRLLYTLKSVGPEGGC